MVRIEHQHAGIEQLSLDQMWGQQSCRFARASPAGAELLSPPA